MGAAISVATRRGDPICSRGDPVMVNGSVREAAKKRMVPQRVDNIGVPITGSREASELKLSVPLVDIG